MSFMDTLKDPVKAVKDGWNSFTTTVSHGADVAGDLLMTPVRATRDLTAKVVSSVTNIDENSIKESLNTVGTTLTSSLSTLTGLNSIPGLPKDAATVVKSISDVALFSSPLSSAISLTKVAANKWMNADNTVSIEHVDSLKNNATAGQLDSAWAAYDKQNGGKSDESKVTHVDFSPEIYTNKEEVGKRVSDSGEKTTATSREYTNAAGEQVKVGVNNGEMTYAAMKDGQKVTDAVANDKTSTLTHYGIRAQLDKAANTLTVTGEQFSMLQKNGAARIDLSDHRRIEKGLDGIIKLFDCHGQLLQRISMGQIHVGNDVHMFKAGTDLTAKAQEANAEQSAGEQPTPKINVFIAGGNVLAQLNESNTLIERRAEDGNVMIRLSSGQVLLVEAKTGTVLVMKDGKFEAVSADSQEAQVASKALNASGVKVDDQEVAFHGGSLNMRRPGITWHNENNEERHVDLTQAAATAAASKVTVKTDTQTIVAAGDKVQTTDAAGNQYKSNLVEGDLATPQIHVTQKDIRIKQDNGKEAIVKPENEVEFDGGKGPVLHRDGSMKLDEQTSVDAKGNVTSGSWHASYADGGAGSVRAGMEVKATNASMNGLNAAHHIYAKACSGMVTFSDISSLNTELGDVTAMINMLAAAGCGDLIAQLQNTCASIIETINFATPKAQAAQIAMDRGITSPSVIKQIEDGTSTRTPEQAAKTVLMMAA